MIVYAFRRLLALVPTALAVSFLVFLLIHMVPGDPVRAMVGADASPEEIAEVRADLGLDRPLLVQFGEYVVGLLQGDMGTSVSLGVPVAELVLPRFPATIELTVVALLLSGVIAIPLGVAAAQFRATWVDALSVGIALAGAAIPVFWLGLVLLYVFGIQLPWFPITGRGGPLWTAEGWHHITLPAITLGTALIASNTRLVRASMLDVFGKDYIRTARSKGLREGTVVYRHALRNALIPVVTNMGLQLGVLLGGAILTETVFTWPGIGRLAVQSIARRDFPVVQAVALIVAMTFVVANTLVDLMYGFLDPRIRYD